MPAKSALVKLFVALMALSPSLAMPMVERDNDKTYVPTYYHCLRATSLSRPKQPVQLQERRTGQVRSRRRAEEQAQPATAARRPRSKTMRHQGPRRRAR